MEELGVNWKLSAGDAVAWGAAEWNYPVPDTYHLSDRSPIPVSFRTSSQLSIFGICS